MVVVVTEEGRRDEPSRVESMHARTHARTHYTLHSCLGFAELLVGVDARRRQEEARTVVRLIRAWRAHYTLICCILYYFIFV